MKENSKVIYLLGLSCANCASKIEREVGHLDGVKSASVDTISQKLTIEMLNKNNHSKIIKEATKIALRIEPSIKISHSNEDHHFKENDRSLLIKLSIFFGILLFVIGIAFKFSNISEFSIFIISYLLIGGEVLLKALRNILRGQVFDENFLMSIATIGAFAIGQYPEGVAVMLFYEIGIAFQDAAIYRSKKSISALMDIRPDFANLKTDDKVKKVTPEKVHIGDYILVKPGEKIPLDGIITEGKSTLDTSALTGESIPIDVGQNDTVLSGSINNNGLLVIQVTKTFGESTVSKILDLVQNASSNKAPTENFITKFARYYTPVIVFAAIALAIIPPLVIHGASFAHWINRALVFLVVSCPCALVISIPLSFFGGIGGASKNGILIKGSNFLEALNNVDTVVFDKTGTLTKGVFKVTEIKSVNNLKSDELLYYAAYAESQSNHPIAISIQKAYNKEIDLQKISNYKEIIGQGIKVNIEDKEVLAGNTKLMESENIDYEQIDEIGTIVYLAINKEYIGYIVISDEVKLDSVVAVIGLKDLGVKHIAMLTGDNKKVGERVAHQIGLDEVYTNLLPHEKIEKLEILENKKTTNGNLIFVGDGINDAPVLARADIGIAMGGVGSDAAIEAADIVIMTDEPSKIVSAIKIAKNTRKIVWQNIIFALSVKAIILVLGAFGIANMWEAVFGDVGVAIIAILNSTRAMRVSK